MPSAEQIVDALLESDEIGDFVAHSLGTTDPFHTLGQVNRDAFGSIYVQHFYDGKKMKCTVSVRWNAKNRDFSVSALLQNRDNKAVRSFDSFWQLEPAYLERANDVMIKVVKRFDEIADTMEPPQNSFPYPDSLKVAGDDAMLLLDDEFYQFVKI